jgi:hypothetical protein
MALMSLTALRPAPDAGNVIRLGKPPGG